MSITLTVSADSALEFSATLRGLAAVMPESAQVVPVAPQPQRASRSAKSTAAVPPEARVATPDPEEAADTPEPDETPATTVTKEEVRAKLAALAQKGKQAEVKDALSRLGVTRLSDLDPKNYGRLMDLAREIA